MGRWDFDCQKCKGNIGTTFFRDREWYRCAQDRNSGERLWKSYLKYIQNNLPSVAFDSRGNVTEGVLPNNPAHEKTLKEEIKAPYGNGTLYHKIKSSEYHGAIFIFIDYKKLRAWWSQRDESAHSEENYQRAGLKKHEVQSRGWWYFGYCFCVNCAKELKYKCPVCGSKLVKVTNSGGKNENRNC